MIIEQCQKDLQYFLIDASSKFEIFTLRDHYLVEVLLRASDFQSLSFQTHYLELFSMLGNQIAFRHAILKVILS